MTWPGDGRPRTQTWSSSILCSSPQTMLTLMTSTLYPVREPFLERMMIEVGFERRPGFAEGSWYTSWIQWQCHRHGAGGEKIMLREQEGRLADLYTLLSFLSAFRPQLPNPCCLFQLLPLLPYLPTTLHRFSL